MTPRFFCPLMIFFAYYYYYIIIIFAKILELMIDKKNINFKIFRL